MAAPFPVQPSLVFCAHDPTQLVAPRAVTIAVAILAIICTMNLIVSFFVIMVNL